MRLRKGLLSGIAGLTAAAALALTPAAAFAQYGPPSGGGGGGGTGGGGGVGETETVTNNLSVPTIFVGTNPFSLTCGTVSTPSALATPTGDPLTGYPIDKTAYYYVQGVNTWQAQCYTATLANATAAWGDNLTGSAVLRPGYPIRVELGLMNSDTTAPSMDGYTVVKLDPEALDRVSAYGTLATLNTATNTYSATPTLFAATAQRVYDSGVTFSIKNADTGAYVVQENTTATAEINATGNVVYGYNLRVSDAGRYTITFTVPTVTITGTDAGVYTSHSVALTISVTTSGGGGGGGGHHGGR